MADPGVKKLVIIGDSLCGKTCLLDTFEKVGWPGSPDSHLLGRVCRGALQADSVPHHGEGDGPPQDPGGDLQHVPVGHRGPGGLHPGQDPRLRGHPRPPHRLLCHQTVFLPQCEACLGKGAQERKPKECAGEWVGVLVDS